VGTEVSQHPDVSGVIHDIGYRHYDGPRLGRGHAVLALYVHSLRGVFGLGRPARSKVVPFLLFGVICVPALVSAAVALLTPLQPFAYTAYAFYLQVAIMLFVAAQAPPQISSDLRFRVLPLYFSRPMERDDYVWAKVAAVATGVLIVLAAPMLIIYASALLGHVHSVRDAWEETQRFLTGLGGAAVHAVLLASVAVAIASLTKVRAFAIVAIIGVYLVSSAVVGTIVGVAHGTAIASVAGLFTPFQLLDWFQAWAFGVRPTVPPGPGAAGPLYGLMTVALTAGALAFLLVRYRRAER
jgi:ABC-2 type transport system permease protein